MMAARALIAIVVPVFNERDNLRHFHDAVAAVAASMPDYDWEFMFVDDGSRDGSFDVLRELRAADPRVRAPQTTS